MFLCMVNNDNDNDNNQNIIYNFCYQINKNILVFIKNDLILVSFR